MNLINKYKPTSFKEFILDDSHKQLIETLLNIDTLNVLFKGDSCSGKTTIINIIINEYYKEEFKNESLKQKVWQNNIYKINSLNEQGVNLFRQFIKSFCKTISVIPNKKKFVIIDEIDILNQSNQQILRNCIDKYSNKVNFICSCVNIQNVLDNIQSRLLIFNLPKLQLTQLDSMFSTIIQKEHILINSNDLRYLYKICNNNINIIFNNLQKLLLTDKTINIDLIKNVCTNINFSCFEEFITSILDYDVVRASNILKELYKNGFSVNDILETFFEFLKITSVIDDKIKFVFIKIIGKYITNFYTIHDNNIELFLFAQDLIESIESE